MSNNICSSLSSQHKLPQLFNEPGKRISWNETGEITYVENTILSDLFLACVNNKWNINNDTGKISFVTDKHIYNYDQ